mmetsp:Transcript_9489/g.17216  ORF Transcript_9489/g.17216 Transcript_9489/m.17216 type:complete len:264 (+) Transcript_9489:791-1582(+)
MRYAQFLVQLFKLRITLPDSPCTFVGFSASTKCTSMLVSSLEIAFNFILNAYILVSFFVCLLVGIQSGTATFGRQGTRRAIRIRRRLGMFQHSCHGARSRSSSSNVRTKFIQTLIIIGQWFTGDRMITLGSSAIVGSEEKGGGFGSRNAGSRVIGGCWILLRRVGCRKSYGSQSIVRFHRFEEIHDLSKGHVGDGSAIDAYQSIAQPHLARPLNRSQTCSTVLPSSHKCHTARIRSPSRRHQQDTQWSIKGMSRQVHRRYRMM